MARNQNSTAPKFATSFPHFHECPHLSSHLLRSPVHHQFPNLQRAASQFNEGRRRDADLRVAWNAGYLACVEATEPGDIGTVLNAPCTRRFCKRILRVVTGDSSLAPRERSGV